MSSDVPESSLSLYDQLKRDLSPTRSRYYELLFDGLDQALERISLGEHEVSVKKKKHFLREQESRKLTAELFQCVEKAGKLPVEYPADVAYCVKLARRGADLSDFIVDNLMHRCSLDVICRCGLTCHLLALILDGQVTTEQLFKTNYLQESPFMNAVISNQTETVYAVISFNGARYNDAASPGENEERLSRMIRAPGVAGRLALHYCAINRNKLLFQLFLSACPETLMVLDRNDYTPALYLLTPWVEAHEVLEEAFDMCSADKLLTVMNSADDAENGTEIAFSPASPFAAGGSVSDDRNMLCDADTSEDIDNKDVQRQSSEELNWRRYYSCIRSDLKISRDLINWAAQDATHGMLVLLLEKLAQVTETGKFINGIYFQHLLRYEADTEPILTAFTSGAEINFMVLLEQATPDLFCETLYARQPPPGLVEGSTDDQVSFYGLVEKYFTGGESSIGLASNLMLTIICSTLFYVADQDEGVHDRSATQSGTLERQFKKARECIDSYLQYDIARRTERAVLLFDILDSHQSLPRTKVIRKSFNYCRSSRLSDRTVYKLNSDDAAETMLMPKLRCDCEFYETACSVSLPTKQVDWPPYSHGCPCLGPLAQQLPNSFADNNNNVLRIAQKQAPSWSLIPDLQTFPRMADYKWERRWELEQHKGPLVFDLRVTPRTDDGTDMAYLFACGDECRCDQSNCPTSTLFSPSRCFFEVCDFGANNGAYLIGQSVRLGMQRYGLSTRQIIAEGQFVGKIVGEICTLEDVNELMLPGDGQKLNDDYSTNVWQYVKQLPLPFGKTVTAGLTQNQCEAFDLYVNQYANGNFTRFIRHACTPDANLSVHLMLPRGVPDLRRREMVLFANRNINAGDELTLDFGDWYLSIAVGFCGCASASCRKPAKRELL